MRSENGKTSLRDRGIPTQADNAKIATFGKWAIMDKGSQLLKPFVQAVANGQVVFLGLDALSILSVSALWLHPMEGKDQR